MDLLITTFVFSYLLSLTIDLGRSLFEVFLNLLKKEDGVVLSPTEVAFVIPCHNSESVISQTLETLPKNYIIYCVANGCTDNTLQVLKSHSHIKVLQSEKGKMTALLAGVAAAKKAGFTHVVLLDDDIEWYDCQIKVKSKEIPLTALPVVPTIPDSWIHAFQCLEYQLMVVSKRGQSHLGNTTMASGAAGVYRIDTLLEVLKFHDGEHIGDDLQCSFIHHLLGYQVDFVSSPVVRTHPPNDLKSWFKQRAKRWEISPVYNLPLLLSVVFALPGWGPGWWIRFVVLYRIIVVINDLFRCFSFPFVLVYSPGILFGLFGITWVGLACKISVYRSCYKYYPINWDKLSALWTIFYPLYGVMTWITRLYALPKALKMLWVGYAKNKRTTLRISVEEQLK